MRRSVAAVVVALSTALSVTAVVDTSSAAGGSGHSSITAPDSARAEATQALQTAQHVVSGSRGHAAPSPTLALLHLALNVKNLDGRQLAQAHSLLARPTQGGHDPFGDGYTMKAKKKCKGHFCLHWVPRGADAPPNHHWVKKMLKMMNHVWHFEIGKLNYRKPPSDGSKGGNGKFDVYLKDLAPKGYYGYCAGDGRVSYSRRLLSGFCVLDNDFARSQYHAPPLQSATVTAAHEFFHAIQFGYDAAEDPWLLETTATWMEERFNDKSNDNRQYLPDGQLSHPNRPLDTFQVPCCAQYANWLFFEYLSSHYGRSIVHRIWDQAAAYGRHAGHKYSAKAIAAALRHHGGFTKVFAKYAAGNITPQRSYPEGSHYPHAGFVAGGKLSKARRHGAFVGSVHHMASKNVAVVPAKSLSGKKWRLRVKVHGPSRKKAPAVMLVVQTKHGKWVKKLVHLNRKGNGKASVGFNHKRVKGVTITLANTSTRFHACYTRRGRFSCHGVSSATKTRFKVKMVAYKR